MAYTSPRAGQKIYTNFVNEKPWVDPEVPLNPIYVPSYPGTNASALFGYEKKRKSLSDPPAKKQEEKKPDNSATQNPSVNPVNDGGPYIGSVRPINNNAQSQYNTGNGQSGYTEIERGLNVTHAKLDAVDRKVDKLDESYKEVPKKLGATQSNMAYDSSRLEEMEWRNKLHSAKLHDLERELANVRMQKDTMKGRMGPGGPMGAVPEEGGYNNGYGSSPRGHPDPYPDRAPPAPAQDYGQGQRREYKNDQYGHAHHAGGADGEEPYWGFNRFYNPQYVTAYRREHVPLQAKHDERARAVSNTIHVH